LWLIRQWRLARDGIIVRGRVLRKLQPIGKVKGPVSGVIKYDFLTPRGEYVENSVLVGETVLHLHEEGADIEVVYLKNDPTVNGVKSAVNYSRETLKLPPL
jgi:hypothetical protein